MNCSVCNQKIDRGNVSKVTCSDCASYFHCSCVNIKKMDFDYMIINNIKYRCDKCNALRRKSLQQQPLSLPATNGQQQFEVKNQNAGQRVLKSKQNPPSSLPSTKIQQQLGANVQIAEQTKQQHRADISAVTQQPAKKNEKNPDQQQQQHHDELSESPTNPMQQCSGLITLNLLYEEIISLKKINIDFLTTIQELKVENAELKLRVNNLESKLNWREQKEVENDIEIVGVPKVENGNAEECVQRVLSEALNITVAADDIKKCYVKRIKTSDSTFGNIVCAKLSSLDVKMKIMSGKKSSKEKLNASIFGGDKKNNIYINDCFTKYTRDLFMSAKRIKIEKKFKYLWFKNSKILLRKVDNGEVSVIRSFNDLNTIIN